MAEGFGAEQVITQVIVNNTISGVAAVVAGNKKVEVAINGVVKAAKGAAKSVQSMSTVYNTLDKNGKLIKSSTNTVSAGVNKMGKDIKIVTSQSTLDTTKWGGALANMMQPLNNIRWAFVNLSFIAMGLMALAAPFIWATKQAMEFENQLKKIQSVTGTMPEESSKVILSAREGRPFTTTQVSEGFLEFSKAGFSAEQATESLIPILNLAQAGMMDVGRAASLTAQVMQQFANEGVTAIEVADTLSSVADLTRASEEGLGSALSYVGTIAAAMNQTMESTVQLLGILTNKGLNASKAGTGLRQVYASLMDPSEKAGSALNKLGVSMTDASGEIKPMTQFLRQLKVSLDGLSAGEKQNILGEIFEIRALAAVEAFMGELDNSITALDEFAIRADRSGYSMVKAMVQSTSATNTLTSATNDFKVGFLDAGLAMSEGVKSSVSGLETLGKVLGYVLNGFVIGVGFVLRFLSIIGEIPKVVKLVYLTITGQIKKAREYADEVNREKKDAAWLFFGMKDKSRLEKVSDEIKGKQELISGEGVFDNLDTGTDVMMGFETIANFSKVLETNFGKAGTSLIELYKEFTEAEKRSKKLAQELNTVKTEIDEAGEKDARDSGLLNKKNRLLDEFNDGQTTLLDLKTKIGNIAIGVGLDREFVDNIVEGGDVLTNFIEKIDLLKVGLERQGDITKVFDKLLGLDKIYDTSEKLKTIFEDSFQSIVTTAHSLFKKGAMDEGFFISILGDISQLESYVKQIHIIEDAIVTLTERKKELTGIISDTTTELNKEKEALKELKEQLSEVNKTISELSKPRFEGQLDVEILIQNIDREMKKRKLADVGITDSYTFLQNALSSAKGGYDELFDSIENVTSATKGSQSSYEAWQQTVQEFIRDTVKSGNTLSMNVSGAVNKFSTLLLSTSQFNDETSKTSDYLSYLKDAYDVYYGGMTDNVNDAVQAHKEEVTGVFNSSAGVISALQDQWEKQTQLTSAVAAQQEAVDTLENKLQDYKEQMDDITNDINDQKDAVLDLVKAFKELATAMSLIKTVDITAPEAVETSTAYPGSLDVPNSPLMPDYMKSPSSNIGGTLNNIGDWSFDASNPGQSISDYFDEGGYLPYGDFVMRQGQKPVSFSPSDTLFGMDMTKLSTPSISNNSQSSSNVSIGDINVSTQSEDAQDIADTIARTIKNELKTK